MERIFETIRKYNMISAGMTVVAGVSGGADSVCMLYALAGYREKVPFNLRVVHVEHGIRGEQSLADAEYTRELCSQLEISCCIRCFPVEKIAEEKGISVEEAGRIVRYQSFREELEKHGGGCIAVAHHENDQAETVLWNLIRGSGLRGLGGMRPVNGDIIRPLLFLKRESIEQILRERGIIWRTDQTNLEQEYSRNRIRLSILPEMERLNSEAVHHISEAAGHLREAEQFLNSCVEAAAERCIIQNDRCCLDLDQFGKEPPYLKAELIRKMLRDRKQGAGLKDVDQTHIQNILALTEERNGSAVIMLPGNTLAVREYSRLYFKESEQETDGEPALDLDWSVDGEYEWNHVRIRIRHFLIENCSIDEIVKENQYTKWIDYDMIRSGMCVRHRKPGDYLMIHEKNGRKKLKDYFINEKIPQGLRDRLWVIADQSHVIWIPGYRLSAGVKVNKETRHVIRIEWIKEIPI